ncbi:MAG: hypothetical protein KHX31_06370 [Akkermansia sp.]|nr:hypothetical protein [Akkermansia sp.]
MYSINTNNQQDGRRQALSVRPDPNGDKVIITIEDMLNADDVSGLHVHFSSARRSGRETPARKLSDTLYRLLRDNPEDVVAIIASTLNREGQQ